VKTFQYYSPDASTIKPEISAEICAVRVLLVVAKKLYVVLGRL